MKKSSRRQAGVPRVKPPDSEVVLWHPRIVIASRVELSAPRLRSGVATPDRRPETVERRLAAAVAVLETLADAPSLAARASDARARASAAASARERVSAAMTAYRLEASLDDALAGTYRQVADLMEARGLL